MTRLILAFLHYGWPQCGVVLMSWSTTPVMLLSPGPYLTAQMGAAQQVFQKAMTRDSQIRVI